MFAFLAAKFGSTAVSSFAKGLLATVLILATLASIFGVYRHVENSRTVLINEAHTAASAQVQSEVSAASAEAIRTQTLKNQALFDKLNMKQTVATTLWDGEAKKIDDLPISIPPSPVVPVPPYKIGSTHVSAKRHPHRQDPAVPLRDLDAESNRLLERASAF